MSDIQLDTTLSPKAKRAFVYIEMHPFLEGVESFALSKGAIPPYMKDWRKFRLQGDKYTNTEGDTRYRFILLDAQRNPTGPGAENIRPE